MLAVIFVLVWSLLVNRRKGHRCCFLFFFLLLRGKNIVEWILQTLYPDGPKLSPEVHLGKCAECWNGSLLFDRVTYTKSTVLV